MNYANSVKFLSGKLSARSQLQAYAERLINTKDRWTAQKVQVQDTMVSYFLLIYLFIFDNVFEFVKASQNVVQFDKIWLALYRVKTHHLTSYNHL